MENATAFDYLIPSVTWIAYVLNYYKLSPKVRFFYTVKYFVI